MNKPCEHRFLSERGFRYGICADCGAIVYDIEDTLKRPWTEGPTSG